MAKYQYMSLAENVEEMFIGPFGSSLKNDSFVGSEEAYCMVYEQKHAIQGTMDVETRYVNRKKYDELKRFTVKGGDIIVSCRGTIGKTYVVPDDAPIGIMHPSIMKIRLKSDVYNKNYFNLLLRNILKQHELDANGSGVKMAISAKELGATLLPVPPIEEQNHIATMFDQVSTLISLRKQQIAKLDELVKSRFIEMFGDCLTNPKGWKTKCLEDVADVGSSKRVFVEELKEDGIPFYRGTEVGVLAEGKEVFPELFITEEHYSELCEATGAPRVGDLLMPSICPDGRIWIVNTDKPFYFKDGRVLWVHNIGVSYNPIFLLYTLKDRIMTDYSSIASGTTFAELKIFALKKCRIFDVPLTMQNEFAAFIEQTDKSKLTIQHSLAKLETLKKSLMQKYFG